MEQVTANRVLYERYNPQYRTDWEGTAYRWTEAAPVRSLDKNNLVVKKTCQKLGIECTYTVIAQFTNQ